MSYKVHFAKYSAMYITYKKVFHCILFKICYGLVKYVRIRIMNLPKNANVCHLWLVFHPVSSFFEQHVPEKLIRFIKICFV